MSKLFISHSSKNNFHAIAMQDWLIEQGWDELFLDLDPERGIVAGQRWEKALHDAASRCDAVLFLVSQDWLDSDWCRKEFRLAHRLNKRIIGILIEDIAIDSLPDELTSTWQLINLASGNDHQLISAIHPDTGEQQHVHYSKAGLSRLKAGLVKAGLNPLFFQWPPTNDPDRSPYRGMLPLEAEDAGIFFGREAPSNELLAKLRGLRSDPPPRFMVILGASGAGKSSFLRAGVLPRLARDERNFITLPIIRPEHEVLWGESGLLASLSASCKQYKLGINRATLKKKISTNPQDLIQLLQQLSEKAKPTALPGETNSTSPTLVMTIDQGEELFNSEGIEQATTFLKLIKQLAQNQELPLIILFTIRSDTYEQLQTNNSLEGITQQTFSLAPMPQGAYQAIIEGPAQRLKGSDRPLLIEAALTQQLLEDLEKGGNKDALPILAFTLERLYINYGDDGDLRLDEYHDMGGIDGAIKEAVAIALKKAQQDPSLPNDKQAIKDLLRRGLIPWLAGIDPDSQTPRRRVAKLSEIPTEARPIINHLIEQRLLATDTDDDNETTIEPAHESLLRQWGLLKGWLKEDLAVLTTLEAVQRASRDWAANNQTSDYLAHNAGRLQDAEELKQRDDLARFLTQNDWGYLKACRELENQQRDKELAEAKKLAQAQKQETLAQKKVAKRTTIGMIAAFILTLVAGFMGWHSYKAQKLALIEKNKATQANIESQEQLVEANHNFGLALFEKAKKEYKQLNFDKANFYSANALLNIKDGLERGNIISQLYHNIDKKNGIWSSSNLVIDSITSNIAFSPDGKTLASGSNDKAVRLWDVTSGKERALLQGHSDIVTSVAFTPDGKTLAVGSRDDTILLWNVASGEQKYVLLGHSSTAINVTFDPTVSKLTDNPKNRGVTSIVFSPDNKTLASGSWDKTIRLWDVVSGQQKAVLQGQSSAVFSVAFTPDGKTLASGSNDKTIRLWDVESGKQETVLQAIDSSAVLSVAFNPDGKTLASGYSDKTIRLWDIASGKQKAVLQGHFSGVTSVTFSPDGKTLASGSWDKSIRLWDVVSGQEKAVLQGHNDRVISVVFTPDGKTLASGSIDKSIRFWDVVSGQEKVVSQGHRKEVSSVAFSPDGRTIASGSGDKTIGLWDVANGKQKAVLQGHSSGVISLAFSPDGMTLASGSGDKTIRLWDVASDQQKAVLRGHSYGVFSLAFSPDGKTLASGSDDKTIRLWDVASGQQKAVLHGHRKGVTSVAFSPDGKTLASGSNKTLGPGSNDKTIRLWDVASGQQKAVLQGPTSDVTSVTFSPDGKTLASGSWDKTIRLWDVASSEQKAVLHGHSDWVTNIAFSPDGKTLASGSKDNTIRLWDVASSKQTDVLHGHSDLVTNVAFSLDGKTLASASYDATIRFWVVESRKDNTVLHGHYDWITRVAFTPDGETLISRATDETIRHWDIASGKQKAVMQWHRDGVGSMAFSLDGKIQAYSSYDRTIHLWDIESGKEKAVLYGHSYYIGSLAFTPDGETLASGSNDTTIRLWDVASGQQKAVLQGHSDWVRRVVFSPDGKTLASESTDSTIRLWDVASGKQKTVLQGHGSRFGSVVFSPDGKTLAYESADKTISLWDVESSKEKAVLRGNCNPSITFSPDGKTMASGTCLWDVASGTQKFHLPYSFMSVIFSPDSKTLATASNDTTISLWDITSGKKKVVLQGHRKTVENVAFSPDGKTLASVSNDTTIRLWDLELSYNLYKDKVYVSHVIEQYAKVMNYKLEGINVEIKPPAPSLFGAQSLPPQWPKTHPFHWLEKANNGNAEAMLQLGIIYHRDSNNDKAKQWYTKALEAGHPQAQQRLDVLELTSKFDTNNKEK